MKSEKKRDKISNFFISYPTHLKSLPPPPYLDLDSLAAKFYQIFKQIEIMTVLHTCNQNVLIEGERNIP